MIKIIKYTLSQTERSLSLQPENLRCNGCGKLLFRYSGLTGGEIVIKCNGWNKNLKIKCGRLNRIKFTNQ
ncbi:hypothetical protein CL633_04520 [bacterium]|jgi:phage FluMu protein Com|nr:hypothetical protein [bacterium]